MKKIIIIGGGIIGLASAYKLTLKYPDIRAVVLEKEARLAAHQTGNNSGVIHSGIYYRPGSLKARNCREGVRQLLAFCTENEIPYELCGKIIVATSNEELPRLSDLYERGKANGVPDVEFIGPDRLKEIEPHVQGLKALVSPSTGIVDYSLITKKMAELILQAGGEIKTSTKVIGLKTDTSGIVVETTTGSLHCNKVINCGGLYSDRLSRLSGLKSEVKIIPFRGEYYQLADHSRHLVKNLIYPVPDPRFPFLGVHFTRRLNGQIEAGPNAVFAFAREGYSKLRLNPAELWESLSYPAFWKVARSYWKTGLSEYYRSFYKPAFVKALQKLVPEITGKDLKAGGAGVRAQALHRDGQLLDDFVITRTDNIINVLNAPSPAATSSLSIADHIVELTDNMG
ncbi:MAG: L-2-hydroxyglutarate oxidase [FCB group bacterium]|nr:L-2-hydroxyglutarate oxidase [FCB group bacterium]